MKIALVQMNPTVGDLENNSRKIIDFCQQAQHLGADMVVTPELSLTGYPPKDLVLRTDFLRSQERVLDAIAQAVTVPVLIGAAIRPSGFSKPYNAAVLCQNKSWQLVARKILLPNYNVFDEKRYFSEPKEPACSVITINQTRLLITICEDAWASQPNLIEATYDFDPIKNAFDVGGADIIVNMSASPFSAAKPNFREQVFTQLAKTYQTPLVMVGQVGGNDQLMFDGHSMVVDKAGHIIKRAQSCAEELLLYDPQETATPLGHKLSNHELLIEVLAMGIRDYVEKCGAGGVLIGISGGIDSAVCVALAVRALGKERVLGVFLPSRFSSPQSLHDAQLLANNLAIKLDIVPIEQGLNQLRSLVWDKKLALSHRNEDVLDQNLQSRLRGLLIMAISNATDYLMVTTSNKSELAVGYATIYGDLCGAFSPLGDVYKTGVYALAEALNKQAGFDLVPTSIIHRPPSAELKPEQLDIDSLPDYNVLDKILFNFIDLEKSIVDIGASTGIETSLIQRVIGMVSVSEYKRRQGPMPFMVSDKVFGDARRLPIAKRVKFA